MIQAFITDLDGTILPKGGVLSQETVQAFQAAKNRNCTCIIATGRNLYSTLRDIPEDLPLDYLVFSSGAGILRWADRKIIFTRHLSQQESRDIAAYLWDYNINFTIQREIPDNHRFYYTDIYPLHEDYKRRLSNYLDYGSLISSPLDIEGQTTQFVMILDGMQLRTLENIRKDLSTYSVVRSTSPLDNRAIWLEIFAADINKGSTCKQLLQDLNIALADCVGIGNDYNDVDFLDICGQGFMVANAPSRLKPHYKSVASDRNNGFAEFITKTVLVNN